MSIKGTIIGLDISIDVATVHVGSGSYLSKLPVVIDNAYRNIGNEVEITLTDVYKDGNQYIKTMYAMSS